MGYIRQPRCNWYTESTTTVCRNHCNICEWHCNWRVVIIATNCWNNYNYMVHGTVTNLLHFCNLPGMMCVWWADLQLRRSDLGIPPWGRWRTSPIGHDHPQVWVAVVVGCNARCDKGQLHLHRPATMIHNGRFGHHDPWHQFSCNVGILQARSHQRRIFCCCNRGCMAREFLSWVRFLCQLWFMQSTRDVHAGDRIFAWIVSLLWDHPSRRDYKLDRSVTPQQTGSKCNCTTDTLARPRCNTTQNFPHDMTPMQHNLITKWQETRLHCRHAHVAGLLTCSERIVTQARTRSRPLKPRLWTLVRICCI
jgi:hypothetical protein